MSFTTRVLSDRKHAGLNTVWGFIIQLGISDCEFQNILIVQSIVMTGTLVTCYNAIKYLWDLSIFFNHIFFLCRVTQQG